MCNKTCTIYNKSSCTRLLIKSDFESWLCKWIGVPRTSPMEILLALVMQVVNNKRPCASFGYPSRTWTCFPRMDTY